MMDYSASIHAAPSEWEATEAAGPCPLGRLALCPIAAPLPQVLLCPPLVYWN